MIYLQTVVSEFSARFVQSERANIVQLVTFISYIVALLMAVKLVRMLQRGDHQFNVSMWRWLMGVLFTILFPNFLSTILLRKQVSDVVMEAPITPDTGDNSGMIADEQMQNMLNEAEEEKENQLTPARSKANYEESELGGTINDPLADPKDYGEDVTIED